MKTFIQQTLSLVILLCAFVFASCKKEVQSAPEKTVGRSEETARSGSGSRWEPDPFERYRIRNYANDFVLQVKSYNEEAITQGTWNGADWQLWRIEPIWNSGGSYVIINGYSGKVLTGLKGFNGPISYVIQEHNSWSIPPLLQAWWIKDEYNGRFILKPGFHDYALTSFSDSSGDEVTIYPYTFQIENQEWYIELPPS